jgi:tetratricopeptide (TPR) repeat protein
MRRLGEAPTLDDLATSIAAAVGEGSAAPVTFVAGPPMSGRTWLLRRIGRRLAEADPCLVIAGGHESGAYVSWDGDAGHAAGELAEKVLDLGGRAIPVFGLLAQLLALSLSARRLATSLANQPASSGFSVVAQLLAAASAERRVVCLVDDAECSSDGLLGDLLLFLARIAADTGTIRIVATLEGPERLGAHEPDESEALYVARRLHDQGRAQWVPMPVLGDTDVEALVGPAQYGTRAALLQASEARPGWMVYLWEDWRRRGVVTRQASDARWTLAGEQGDTRHAVLAVIARRLAEHLGDDIAGAEQAFELLSWAALEGQRFTVAVVAECSGLGDEACRALLERLSHVPSGRRPIVRPDTSAAVDHWQRGPTSLTRYRFDEKAGWVALQRSARAAHEAESRSLVLGEALESAYWPDTHLVAATLARLFTDGGRPHKAAAYRTQADVGVVGQVTCWRADEAFEGLAADRSEAGRRHAYELLLAAASWSQEHGSGEQTVKFAVGARQASAEPSQELAALHLLGMGYRRLDRLADARSMHRAVEAIAEREGDIEWLARARHSLAIIDRIQGRVAAAHQQLDGVLELRRRCGDRKGEAYSLLALGDVQVHEGTYGAARDTLEAALAMFESLGDADASLSTRLDLAELDRLSGRFESAASAYERLLEDAHRLGSRDAELRIALEQARLALDGDAGDDEAERRYQYALRLAEALGDTMGVMLARSPLATIAARRGEHEAAIESFRELREGWGELGRVQGEAACVLDIGRTCLAAGKTEEALTELRQALAIFEQIGHQHYVAETRVALARAFVALGQDDDAAAEADAARDFYAAQGLTQLLEEIGDLPA